MSTSNRTIRWIEDIAEQEVLISSGHRTSIDLGKTKDEVLSVETATFVRDLFYFVDYLVKLFNERVQQPALQIRLTRMSEKLEGFQLARNGMVLVFDSASPGVIQFRCEKASSEGMGLQNPSRKSVMFSAVVEAGFGAFDDVEWQFLGSRISAEQLARHYLTEFIQISRSGAASFS
jgi:hypothetical protein